MLHSPVQFHNHPLYYAYVIFYIKYIYSHFLSFKLFWNRYSYLIWRLGRQGISKFPHWFSSSHSLWLDKPHIPRMKPATVAVQ